jgi:two-component system, LytTR family, sensor kinase
MFKHLKIALPKRILILLAHVCGWGMFLGILMFASTETPPHNLNRSPVLTEIMTMIAYLLSFFYFNYYWLIPKIFQKIGLKQYALSLLGTWLIFAMIGNLAQAIYSKGDISYGQFFISIVPFLLITGMGFSIRILIERTAKEKSLRERENETLKSELSFLRSQISPHFLFNVMNNVVALSRIQPEKVEPTLIQLSRLMRYMLYSSDEKKVSIPNEIAYLESYIELQKLRFGDCVPVIFNKNIENTEGGQIEPMLLIPFVENAFKHGVGIDHPKIEMGLIFKNNTLIFNVLNLFDPLSIETKDSDSGIGLKNVKRRLELLYGEHQALKISDADGVFKVDLNIKFSNE